MHSKENSFYQLNHFGIIACGDADSTRFLQGQLTCDINAILEGGGNLAALCNIKGRVKAIMWAFKTAEDYLLALPNRILVDTMASLNKYAVFSKVTLADASQDYDIWGLSSSISTIELPNTTAKQTLAPTHDRITLITKKADHSAVLAKLNQHGQPGNLKQWQQADIENGSPWIMAETAEKFTPHMLNLPQLGAVSFTKGCYLGQEIIARTEYLGKSKRDLKHLTFETQAPLKPGDTLPATATLSQATVLQSIQINSTLQSVLVVV